MARLFLAMFAALGGLLGAGAAGLGAGCGENGDQAQDCTAVGCESEVLVEFRRLGKSFPQVKAVRLCVDGGCGTTLRPKGRSWATGTVVTEPSEREVDVEFEVRGPQRRVLARATAKTTLQKFQPNGPDCEPTCFQSGLRFDRRSGDLVDLPAPQTQ